MMHSSGPESYSQGSRGGFYWAIALSAGFVLLLPFQRYAEIPFSLLATCFPLLYYRHRDRLPPSTVKLVAAIWLGIALPMLLSAFDSYDPSKSWSKSFAAIRLPLAALSMAILLHTDQRRRRARLLTALIVGFWAVDGLIQYFAGQNLLGLPLHPERLNGIFGERFYFFGPTLAIMAPFLLEYARRHWPYWSHWLLIGLITVVVVLSGMRTAWIMLAFTWLLFFYFIWRRHRQSRWRIILLAALTLFGSLFFTYYSSERVQERVQLSLLIFEGSDEALAKATSRRVSILNNSLEMARQHPLNGVGVRAYPKAYQAIAPKHDPHRQSYRDRNRASHAHNFFLETLTDTGLIGMAGLVFAIGAFIRWYRRILRFHPDSYAAVWAIVLMWLPLNSYFSWYGSYVSSLFWWLIGMAAAGSSLAAPRKTQKSKKTQETQKTQKTQKTWDPR